MPSQIGDAANSRHYLRMKAAGPAQSFITDILRCRRIVNAACSSMRVDIVASLRILFSIRDAGITVLFHKPPTMSVLPPANVMTLPMAQYGFMI